MVDPVTGEQVETRVRVSQLLDHLEPTAERYGTSWALLTARALLADNGADRQRYVATERGLMALARWLAQETVSSARGLPGAPHLSFATCALTSAPNNRAALVSQSHTSVTTTAESVPQLLLYEPKCAA